jgi:uncharacterized protein YndB with AHSA1/START domain
VAHIRVHVRIATTPAEIWDELRHIERHVNWMMDAHSISFETEQREGVGTTFICVTKVGPFVTHDRMTVTAWSENEVMGIKHRGIITGSGTISLRPTKEGTDVVWEENLHFPWWAMGELGARVAGPVLHAIWQGNLTRLRAIMDEHSS